MTLEFHTASESSGWCKKLFQYSDDGKTGTATFDGYLYPRGSNTAFIFRPFKSENLHRWFVESAYQIGTKNRGHELVLCVR